MAKFLTIAYILIRYAAQAGAYENALSSAIADYKKVQKIESKLKPVKVFTALSGVLSLTMALKSFTRNSPSSIAYAILGFDLFVVSYNCYIKKYCAVAGKQYFNQVGDKVTFWIKDTLGLKTEEKQADPVAVLNGDIDWTMLMEGTIAKVAVAQVRKQLQSK